MQRISRSEIAYLVEGVHCNVRADGRTRFESRGVTLETSVLCQSNGSAHIKMEHGGTDVLASVKLEVVKPCSEAPKSGVLHIQASCSPSVSSYLAGQRAMEDVNMEMTLLMQYLCKNCMDIDSDVFCIIPEQSVWGIFVDVIVYESAGNTVDLMSMAIFAALQDTLFPRIRVVGGEQDAKSIEVERDPVFGQYLARSIRFPVCITLCKIGHYFILDATLEEELCMSTQIAVAIDENGAILGIQKLHGDGALETEKVQEMIDVACERSIQTIRNLCEAIICERSIEKSIDRISFR